MKRNKGENALITNLIKITIIVICTIIQVLAFILLYGATSTLTSYAEILFEILKFITVIYIIYKPQNPAYKMIWIILIMFFPIGGFLTYLIWGNNKVSKRVANKISQENAKVILNKNEKYENIENNYRKKEAQYLSNVTNYSICNNQTIKYYKTGEECYQKIKEDLKKAKSYILIEFFIISDGKMWEEIYEILKEKSRQNVQIYLMHDSLGSLLKKPKHLKEKLENINVKYLSFNPLTPFIRSYINYRDHRKIIVIDGNVAYTGGINIGDEYINIKSRLGNWKDCGIRITGLGVNNFIVMFFNLWNLNYKKRIDYAEFLNYNDDNLNKEFIIPYSDGPQNKNNPGENTYINIINHARKYVYIMTPYLILDNEMSQALVNASQSGVDVRIITPYIPDKKLVNACTKSFYGQLLTSGIKIYEYTPGFIHSKIIVSDDEVANVGTTNFDFRSFYLNYECGIWMYNTKEELKIKEDFVETIKVCQEIKLETWNQRTVDIKILEAILRLISPLL